MCVFVCVFEGILSLVELLDAEEFFLFSVKWLVTTVWATFIVGYFDIIAFRNCCLCTIVNVCVCVCLHTTVGIWRSEYNFVE